MRSRLRSSVVLTLAVAAAFAVVMPATRLSAAAEGGLRVTLRARPAQGTRLTPALLQDAANVIQRRVQRLDLANTRVQVEGSDRIVVELPAASAAKRAALLKQLEQPGILRFVRVPERYAVRQGADDTPVFTEKVSRKEVAAAQVLKQSLAGNGEILSGRDLLPGKVCANVGNDGQPLLELHFNAAGRKKFADYTLRNVKKHFAIYLDEVAFSAPIVEEPIPGGDGVIHGGFANLGEAQALADLLNSGPLPVPLVVEKTQVLP